MRKWFVTFFIGALSVGTLSAPLALAAAATPAPVAGSTGQGLEISPPVIQLNADPGQTVTASIRVRNVAVGELITKGRADDFGADNSEDGNPKILIDEQGTTRYSLKTWIQSVPDLDLAPQELKTTTVVINVPKDAEPGGHFGVIRFTAVPPSLNGTGVALSASVGTLILLRVSGNVTEKVTVASLKTSETVAVKNKPSIDKITSFFEHGPINFEARLQNEGSVHEDAQGSIVIKNIFGKVVGTVAVNSTGGNVLPGSVRKFTQTFPKKTLFGYYSAKMNLTYLSGKQSLSGSTSFWVIPWKLVLLVIIGAVVVIYLLRVGLRRYNASIIAKARR